jgi:hypothetical protein
MDRERNLKFWRNWSVLRKAQTLGAVGGGFGTFIFFACYASTAPHSFFSFSGIMLVLFISPTKLLAQLFNMTVWLTKNHGSSNEWDVSTICLMAVINTFLLILVGTLVGCCINKLKSHAK